MDCFGYTTETLIFLKDFGLAIVTDQVLQI
jgi:hypothetical protein